MAWNWDLPRSLKGCDWLPTTWDRESCYGGVFMENAVASMPGGHHAPKRVLAQSDGRTDGPSDSAGGGTEDHSEHANHGDAAAPIPFKMRDSADVLYEKRPVDITVPRLNAIWQGDHTPLDIFLVRPDGEFAKPWLTVVIDDYSRAIAGYFLSFDDPSTLHTSLALRQAIWRKGDPRW
jgi:hypothetical protein